MKKIDRIYQQVLRYIMIVLMIIIVLTMLLQTFGRVISKPLSWTFELSCYAFVWLVMIGASVVMRKGKHISISFFVNKLPPKARVVLFYFKQAVMLGSLVVLLKPAVSYARSGYAMKSSAMHLPMLFVDGTVFLSFVLLIIEIIRQTVIGYQDDEKEEKQ